MALRFGVFESKGYLPKLRKNYHIRSYMEEGYQGTGKRMNADKLDLYLASEN